MLTIASANSPIIYTYAYIIYTSYHIISEHNMMYECMMISISIDVWVCVITFLFSLNKNPSRARSGIRYTPGWVLSVMLYAIIPTHHPTHTTSTPIDWLLVVDGMVDDVMLRCYYVLYLIFFIIGCAHEFFTNIFGTNPILTNYGMVDNGVWSTMGLCWLVSSFRPRTPSHE